MAAMAVVTGWGKCISRKSIGRLGILIFMLCLSVTQASVPDVDAVDTESTDTEAAVKCDACLLMATKFGEGFSSAESSMKSVRLSEQAMTEAAEAVCDSQWHGYGTLTNDGATRLAGPETGRDMPGPVDTNDSVWSHRLQDLCDELLAEVTSERLLYETWAAAGGEALETLLCKGEGTFGACATQNWGPWPGDDDYDDYDDGDFEYVHDEF